VKKYLTGPLVQQGLNLIDRSTLKTKTKQYIYFKMANYIMVIELNGVQFFVVFEKFTCAYLFQIALEII